MVDVRHRDRSQQRLCVRMQGPEEQFLLRSLFNHLPQIHNKNVVRNIANDAQIMRNENIRYLGFLLDIEQEVDDLCLNRHIQCGNRFVADYKLRVQDQGTAYADALTASSVKFMGICIDQAARKSYGIPSFHTLFSHLGRLA